MRAYTQQNGEWTLLTGGVWPNPGTKRGLQIVTEDPVSGRIELKGVRAFAAVP